MSVITTTSVPQGSILGPLLFLIYKNDSPNFNNRFNVLRYADDTFTLYANLEDFSYASLELDINSEKLNSLFRLNKLSLNVE